jgi:hypothetical protein
MRERGGGVAAVAVQIGRALDLGRGEAGLPQRAFDLVPIGEMEIDAPAHEHGQQRAKDSDAKILKLADVDA